MTATMEIDLSDELGVLPLTLYYIAAKKNEMIIRGRMRRPFLPELRFWLVGREPTSEAEEVTF